MRWNEWHYYEAARPKPVKNGIKTKNLRGDIGETWWSKRWIQVLEGLGMGARLGRGRAYARQGQVISIDVQKSAVKAQVQGSRAKPYSITIGLVPISDQDWDKVTSVMASQAIFAAILLSGEMPQNIEKAFSEAQVSLFPAMSSRTVRATLRQSAGSALGWKLSGAGGGGYLVLVAKNELPGAIKLKIRRTER